jgi:hypothetical protein
MTEHSDHWLSAADVPHLLPFVGAAVLLGLTTGLPLGWLVWHRLRGAVYAAFGVPTEAPVRSPVPDPSDPYAVPRFPDGDLPPHALHYPGSLGEVRAVSAHLHQQRSGDDPASSAAGPGGEG